jgi:hypothetical protein
MIAQIHQGEMVIPADTAAMVRSQIGGWADLRSRIIVRMQVPTMTVSPTMASTIQAMSGASPSQAPSGATTHNTGGAVNTTNFHYSPAVAPGTSGDIRAQLAAHAAELKSWAGNMTRNGNLQPPRTS